MTTKFQNNIKIYKLSKTIPLALIIILSLFVTEVLYGGGLVGNNFYAGGLAGSSCYNTVPDVVWNSVHEEYLVVWDYRYGSSDHEIMGMRFCKNGKPITGSVISICGGTTADTRNPKVACVGGKYLVVWQQWVSGTWADWVVRGRMNVGGTDNWSGSSFDISSRFDLVNDENPDVGASTIDNSFMVVWQALESAVVNWEIVRRKIHYNGTMGSVGAVTDIDSSDQRRPAICQITPSNYVVVWEDNRNGNWDIYGRGINSDGSFPAGSQRITNASNNEYDPNIAGNIDDYGSNFLVVYQYEFSGSDHDIYGRIVTSLAVGGSNFSINTNPSYQSRPGVSYSTVTRQYLVAWSDNRNAATYSFDIYGARINDSGSVVENNIKIAEASNDQGSAEITYNSSNNEVLVVFDDARHGTTNPRIYGQRFSFDYTAPSNPTSCSQTVGSTTSDVWQNSVSDPNFTWSGASDSGGSGVKGYYYYWGTSASGEPTTWTTFAGYNPGPVGNPSIYYLRVKTKDNAGNVSSATTLYIFKYDGTSPTGSISINAGASYTNSTSVTLTLSASDTGSGVHQMRFSNDNSIWSPWEIYKTSKSWTLAAGDGTRYVYVQYSDNAGNTSLYSDSIILDQTPPIGSILINAGASYTSSTSVTLTLSASDAVSGVHQMRFSNDNTTWSAWEPYRTSKSWTLTAGDGTKYVYVQYKDNVRNISTPYSDAITLDTIAPTASITISPTPPLKTGEFQITLIITDASNIPEKPSLSYTPSGGSPINIPLSGSDKSWFGSSFIESTTPEGTATFSFSAVDAAGNTGTVITAGRSFEIDTTVNVSFGGTVSNSDRTAVDVPPGAYSENINIRIITPDPSLSIIKEANNNIIDDKGIKPIKTVNLYRNIIAIGDVSGKEIRNFDKPITIFIPYPDDDQNGIVDGTNIKEQNLRMFYLDEGEKKWVLVPNSNVDSIRNNVNAEVSHFSIFTIMSLTPPSGLSGVFAYPNPCYIKNDRYVRISNIPLDAKM